MLAESFRSLQASCRQNEQSDDCAMADAERVYWDACVFLAYINAEPGRIRDVDAILTDASKGKIELLTSTVTIAEVAFGAVEQKGQPLEKAIEDKINRLWVPPSPVRLVEFHALIAADAVRLMREVRPASLSLKPMDAIHLATARRLEVVRFETYDDLAKFSPFVGIPILPPAPHQPSLLDEAT